MERFYTLRLDNRAYYFKQLDSVKDFLIKAGVKEHLIDEDDESYSLSDMEELVELPIYVTNKELCSEGEECCFFYLEANTFED